MLKVKWMKCIFLIFISTIFLTGCLYPEDELAKNKIPYLDQIQSVQSAVNQYREKTNGLIPIKNKDAETDVYTKYLVDFSRLVPEYMAEIPSNAFENGGVYQYVIVNPEENPTVKIFDLQLADMIRDIKIRIMSKKHPPYKEMIANNVFTLDYKELGFKEPPVIVSPYTKQNLPFIITGEGNIYVDYRSDLYQLIQKKEHSYKKGDDIRPLLLEDSVFVPAYSLPYTVNDEGEPIFMSDLK